MLGTQMISRIRQVLGVELTMRHLFEAGTLEELAARVDRLAKK
jgi:hypothetical protein